MKLKWHLSLLTIMITVFVAGCSTPTLSPQSPPLSQSEKTNARIENLLREAQQAKPIAAAKLRAEAAQLLLSQKRNQEAEDVLLAIDISLLTPSLRFDIAKLKAQAAQNRGITEVATATLEQIRANEENKFSTQQETERLDLLANLYQQENLLRKEISTRIQLALFTQDPELKQNNHDLIWSRLLKIPTDELSNLIRSGELSYYEQGWYELAFEITSQKQLDTQSQAFSNWSALWQAHPARALPPLNLKGLQTGSLQVRRIAVLLPLTGKLRKPADAIREGIIQAHLRHTLPGQQPPELLFLDSEKINSAIQLAAIIQETGAELVIGPLDKDRVATLAMDQHLSIPILALNQVVTNSRKEFFQFGLSAEDEAAQTADQLWNEGKKSVVTLTPATSWGARIRDAFTEQFTLLGGQVVASVDYGETTDYATNISQLLQTDSSNQRYQKLRNLLPARKLEFEEHRRTDIDSIFLTALPNQARQLQPILAFNFAGNLPIYSTSHVFSGNIDPVLDQDLNKIRFCATPWDLQTPSQDKILISQQRQNASTRFGRLYALGLDAYRLHPYLNQLQALPGTQIQGETGTLSITEQGIIKRRLPWAVFKEGTPQLLQ